MPFLERARLPRGLEERGRTGGRRSGYIRESNPVLGKDWFGGTLEGRTSPWGPAARTNGRLTREADSHVVCSRRRVECPFWKEYGFPVALRNAGVRGAGGRGIFESRTQSWGKIGSGGFWKDALAPGGPPREQMAD